MKPRKPPKPEITLESLYETVKEIQYKLTEVMEDVQQDYNSLAEDVSELKRKLNTSSDWVKEDADYDSDDEDDESGEPKPDGWVIGCLPSSPIKLRGDPKIYLTRWNDDHSVQWSDMGCTEDARIYHSKAEAQAVCSRLRLMMELGQVKPMKKRDEPEVFSFYEINEEADDENE